MNRCANPKCGRVVTKNPVVVTVAGQTLIFGETCARRAGLLPKRGRRWAAPRPLAEPPVEVLDGQAPLPLWDDTEGES